MTARLHESNQKRWERQGIGMIFAEKGLQVLGHVLRQDTAQIGVVPIYWKKFLRLFPEDKYPPFVSEMVLPNADGHPATRKSELLNRIKKASASERHDLALAYIHDQAARSLGLSREKLDIHKPVNDLGFDSLMAVELRSRMATELGVEVAIEDFMESPSIAQIADLLIEKLLLSDIIPSGPPVKELDEDSEEIIL